MTKKDFFIVLIKVFGLYSLVVTLFSILPSILSSYPYFTDLTFLIAMIFSVVLIVTLFSLLLFKSHYIAEKLRLSEGFDEDRIDINNFSSQNIIKLATLLLGGYLFITNIPVILNLAFFALKYDQEGLEFGTMNNFDLGIGMLNFIIGYLLVTNYKFVSRVLIGKESTAK